jgi:lipopolysaccharide transport system ATP-binding protein
MNEDNTVLSLKNVAKGFRLYPSQWSRLKEWLIPKSTFHEMKWLYNDISFDLERGQAIGLVGSNGAGKSTLLKMIVGTSPYNSGAITVNGSVAAILELGMGFQNDFTGRQNAMMAGQLMGHSSSSMEAIMSDIEEFAEIGDYFDQPLRTYSSGMRMRLAFGVVTAFRPDILIIDEALSVGDTYFKHKSFAKIKEFKDLGTSMIIVSHDRGAIQALCDKAVLINDGVVEKYGDAEYVMDYYTALISAKERTLISQSVLSDGRVQTISGSGVAKISSINLISVNEHKSETFEVNSEVTLSIDIDINENVSALVVGFMIKDRFGQAVYGTNTEYSDNQIYDLTVKDKITVEFSFYLALGPGSYSIATALSKASSHLDGSYEWRDLALVFSVANSTKNNFAGVVFLDPDVSIVKK